MGNKGEDRLNIGASMTTKTLIDQSPSHRQANEVMLEAIRISRRDGSLPLERCVIYERELQRLTHQAQT
jgi:hypothetical protein